MDKEGEDGDGGIQNQNPNYSNPVQSRGSTRGRSCKGCLYYSSVQKSKSKYPTCVGFYRTLNQVPSYVVGENRAELPFCVGLEVLYDKRPPGQVHSPSPAHKSEDGVQPIPQPRSYKPHSTGDEYLTRFKRNAGLVRSGVARNLNRVGNHIKQSVDNILFGRSK
ncbi:hypothetical protein M0R45_008401 [Rubus argutus]|uniref:DUF8204 domain-containing protein n=1 Tax=Rubus argutus TaxID=59490 RepID=A0AAW1Y4U0_RUBAR